jgi:hypothetical protein
LSRFCELSLSYINVGLPYHFMLDQKGGRYGN